MPKLVHALVGSDLFLQLEKLKEILREIPPDAQRIDVEGETAQLAEVLDELRSFAMFSSAKVLVVREADEFISRFRAQLEEYVARPAPGALLILRAKSLPGNQRIAKQIAAMGQIHDCNPPKDLVRWITDRAKQAHAVVIRTDAAQLLADLVGDDLGRLDSELAKLALQTDGTVDAEAVATSVSFQREQEMWHMTNEVAAGNTTQALRRWRQLVQLDSSAEFRAVTWLGIWLEKVRKALAMKRAGRRDFDIAKDLKIWPASTVGPFFKTASTLGETGAARLIHLLISVDHRSKSGLGEMAENVERFLLSVANHRT